MATEAQSPARLRARLRKRGAAATLFIVAMTVSVLAAVGLYALRAASIEIMTAGYERQAMQTHYASDYGMLTAATMFDSAGPAEGLLGKTLALCQDLTCQSMPAAELSATGIGDAGNSGCKRLESASVTGFIPAPADVFFAQGADGGLGSLGPSTIQGNFAIEIGTPVKGPRASGYSGNVYSYYIPVTSYGYVGNEVGSTSASTQSSATEVQRAMLVTPPVPQIQLGSCP